jgi:hypothetical protein
MKGKQLAIMVLLFLFLPALAPAARTSISDIWKDKEYQGPAKKIAAFCIMHDTANRILYEDEFVRQLKALGVNAIPGYVIIPPDKFVDKDVAVTKMRDLGVDAVLSTRLIDKLTAKTPVAERPTDSSSGQQQFYEYVYDPRTRGDNEPVYLETTLLELKTERRVWTARSKTKVDVVNNDILADYIDLMLDGLASDKMIEKK